MAMKWRIRVYGKRHYYCATLIFSCTIALLSPAVIQLNYQSSFRLYVDVAEATITVPILVSVT